MPRRVDSYTLAEEAAGHRRRCQGGTHLLEHTLRLGRRTGTHLVVMLEDVMAVGEAEEVPDSHFPDKQNNVKRCQINYVWTATEHEQ